MVQQINDSNFNQEVSQGVCVVDMYADWCGPCRMLSPLLERIAESMQDTGVKFYKLNVDESPNTSAQFGIMGIPTVIVFKDGKEVTRLVGLYPEKAYMDAIKKALAD